MTLAIIVKEQLGTRLEKGMEQDGIMLGEVASCVWKTQPPMKKLTVLKGMGRGFRICCRSSQKTAEVGKDFYFCKHKFHLVPLLFQALFIYFCKRHP